jgi:hypothetical protein
VPSLGDISTVDWTDVAPVENVTAGFPCTGRRRAMTNNPAHGSGAWTPARIRALGAVTDVATAGAIFGLSRNTAYTLARDGHFPTPVLRFGRQYRIAVPAILAALGLPADAPHADADERLDHPRHPRVDHTDAKSAAPDTTRSDTDV